MDVQMRRNQITLHKIDMYYGKAKFTESADMVKVRKNYCLFNECIFDDDKALFKMAAMLF